MFEQSDSQNSQEEKLSRITSVSLSLASPEDIRNWSSGEVTEEDAFNAKIKPKEDRYDTRQINKEGLLSERIFGPVISFCCACGKYRGGKRAQKNEGKHCDKCGVLLAHRSVRRQRMGHIELATPVVHPFFYLGQPCILADLLAVTTVCKTSYRIVEDPGNTDLKLGQYLEEAEYLAAQHFWSSYGETFSVQEKPALIEEKLTPSILRQVIFFERSFFVGEESQQAMTGPEAIRYLLQKLDPLDLKEKLEQATKKAASYQKRKTLSVLLKLAESLGKESQAIRPEWMVLDVLPVIPPISRRMNVLKKRRKGNPEQIEIGDLNRLYSRIIRRNNVLKTLLQEEAPAELLRRSKRSLQRAVNALFENESLPRPVKTVEGRTLRSLLGLLKGKTGRFREALLGKRVDYSGRAVIVGNPKLRLGQCGLPEKIAWKLYQPFIISRLKPSGHEKPKKLLRKNPALAREHLDYAMARYPVLLNRAPTLHRMNVQAFYPVLTSGNAIELHPLVCRAFNADFDGDQMAVHMPLSVEARAEAKILLASQRNLHSPASGRMVYTPSQDMVMGLFYLTMTGKTFKNSSRVFGCCQELELAREIGKVQVHEPIEFRLPQDREVILEGGKQHTRECVGNFQRILTTVGRALFNGRLAEGMPFYNLPLSSKVLDSVLEECFERCGRLETRRLVEEMAALGFSEATRSGLSIGIHDLVIPEKKTEIVKKASEAAIRLTKKASDGTKTSIKAKRTEIWNSATGEVANALFDALRNESRIEGTVNPVFVMAESGARGSATQFKQLSGMRGLMARATGEVADHPITSNFREGLNQSEFFISTHGSRKSFSDISIKTAEGGYLTRRLVHAASEVIVTIHDCGTKQGVLKRADENATLRDAIFGRVSLQEIKQAGGLVLGKNELITSTKAKEIGDTHRKTLRVRSPFTCEAPRGVCQLCYGMDLSTQRLVEVGIAVGVIAAQSIGEPGTQLTMQSKHTGGIVGKDITGGLERVEQLVEGRCPLLRETFVKQGVKAAARYLLSEIQKPYQAQGVAIDDKHIEIVIGQMMSKRSIEYAGDTELTLGSIVDSKELTEANASLPKGSKKARGKVQLLGISKVALAGKSFLAAASFREPKQVLRSAALAGKTDELSGITENVLVGGLIPAGTGFEVNGVQQGGVQQYKVAAKHDGKKIRSAKQKKKIPITWVDKPDLHLAGELNQEQELEELITSLTGSIDDKESWGRIIELGWDRVFRAINRVDDIDEPAARRLTNQVFSNIRKSKASFLSAGAFWKFLWNNRSYVVKNFLSRALKKRKFERVRLQELMAGDELQQDKERKAEAARELLAKIKAEAKLSAYQQVVFDLVWGEGLSDQEIAEKLKKSHGAIRRIKTYIRQKLQNTPLVKEMGS